MIKLKFYLALCVVCACGNGYSQSNSFQLTPTIIPPSPTVSSLSQYGLVPVSMATGRINPEITLFNFKTRNLNLPISLSYDGSALKTDEISSWVGMHWSINCGGVVSRIVRDDEDGANYFLSEYPSSFSPNSPDAISYLEKASMFAHTLDTEPDLYTYNFLGYSGKFIFDRNGDIVSMPRSDLKIQRFLSASSAGGFIITAPDGIRYTFEATETSTLLVSYDATFPPVVTAWYLTKVEHPRGDVITLTYVDNTFTYYVGISETVTRRKSYYQSAGSCQPPAVCPDPGFSVHTSSMYLSGKRLVKIESAGFGSVQFEASKGRSDLDDFKLDGITVKGPDSQTIRRFSLTYEFSNNTGFLNPANTYYEELKHRMFLKSIVEMGNLGDKVREHSFEYEDINGLPARLSYAQDHWGFFNGAQNFNLVPTNLTETDYTGGPAFQGFGGNKEPNASFASKGMLKKISYPTGGSSSFVYGGNTVFVNGGNQATGGIRVEQIDNYDPATNKSELIRYYYAKHNELTKSSGVTSGPPDYVSHYFNRIRCTNPGVYATYYDCPYVSLHSNNLSSLFSMNGNQIYYQFVSLIRDSDQSAGIEEHEFWSDFDNAGVRMWGQNPIKDAPLSSTSWRGGREVNVKYYKKSGGTFILLKHINNSYVRDTRYAKDVPGLVVRKNFEPIIWESAVYQCDQSNVNKVYTYLTCTTDHSHIWLIGGIPFVDGGETSCIASGRNMEWVTYKWHPCYGKPIGSTVTVPFQLDYLDAVEYRNVSNWVYQDKRTEIDYDQNGLNPVTKETYYYYDDDRHMQLSRTQVANSDGVITSISYKYPTDYDTTNNISNRQMVRDYLINYPVKRETVIDGKQASGEVIAYDMTGQPGNIYMFESTITKPVVPHNSQILVPLPDYKLRATNLYDPVTSNLVQAQLTDNFGVQYLWGYNNTLPIAEVKNSLTAGQPVEVPLVNTVTSTVQSSVPETQLTPTFEIFNSQTITPSINVSPQGSNYPPSPLVSVMLRRVDNGAVLGTFSLNWGQGVLPTMTLGPGIYRWSYFCDDIVFGGGFDGISLTISTNYVGRTMVVDKVFHTSFEDNGVANSSSYTGRKVWSGQYTVNLPSVNGSYILSYWMKPTSGSWTFYEQNISVTTGSSQPMIIGATGNLIDEIRLYPKGAQMTTFTYDPLIGLTTITDPNNIRTIYEYDSFGRLSLVKDNSLNILKSYKYKYKE